MRWPRRQYAVIEYGPDGHGVYLSRHWTYRGAMRCMQFCRQVAAEHGWHREYQISMRSR